jgi:hypothetical protein
MSMVERRTFKLSPAEDDEFNRLRPIPGEAFEFWGRVAARRGLSPRTIISDKHVFSGLPAHYVGPWCWPMTLVCQHKP